MLPVRLFLAIVLLSFFGNTFADTKVTITTFNIRMFGYRETESRQPFLKDFIQKNIPASDIMVFEEIIDLSKLKDFLPLDYECLTYTDAKPGHQHVVVCHSPRLTFTREPNDDNDLIDDVSGPNKSWRPAVTAIVSERKGKPLFRIVGVHLKAIPDFSEARVNQARIIGDYLTKVQDKNLPVVITGDFNTYPTPTNKAPADDTELILQAFNETKIGLKHAPNDLFTFRNIFGMQGQFDQFYMSANVNLTAPLKVFEICSAINPKGDGLKDLEYYYEHISDHCPVSAELSF